jgi:hypothetical protein
MGFLEMRLMQYLLVAVILLAAVGAGAETYGFDPIHYAGNEFAHGVGGQLSMDVATASGGSVSITFKNTGSFESEIREIYFYTLTDLNPSANITLGSILNGPGVDFNDGGPNGVNPGNLPAAATWLTDYSLAAAVDSKRGIAPGEQLTLTLNYADPHYDFIDMLHSGQLLVGIHAARIQNVSSVSYINVIPEPASVLLLGLAASSYAFMRRRFIRSAARA